MMWYSIIHFRRARMVTIFQGQNWKRKCYVHTLQYGEQEPYVHTTSLGPSLNKALNSNPKDGITGL